MNYNEISIISKVSNFITSGKLLAYKLLKKDKTLFLNGEVIDEDNEGYCFYDNFLCCHHQNTTEIINVYTNEKQTIPVYFDSKDLYDNTFIVFKNSIREGRGLYSSNYTICQFIPFKELYTLPYKYYGSGYRFENQYIQIQNERKLLKSLSLLTGEYEWEVDLSNIVQAKENWRIEKILGIAHDLLIISIEQPDACTQALALDIHTGALVWYIPQGMVTNATFQLSADASRLVSITMNHLIEIDTATGQILREKTVNGVGLGNGFDPPLRPGRAAIMIQGKLVGDYYYFIGYDFTGKSWRRDLLGVFNWRTEQLEWIHDFEFKDLQSLNNTPEVGSNRLYVLDNQSNLYVFEKETLR